jgi:tetratricopeptide (TPR) repeat protein
MRTWIRLVACVVLALSIAPRAEIPSVSKQLDRYFHGEYEAVAAELAALDNLDDVLEGLKRDAPAWIDAGGPGERSRRALAAATFALEAGRAGAFLEWKLIDIYRVDHGTPGGGQPLINTTMVYWKSPPLLIEWGCALLRGQTTRHPDERTWQLAAIAAAQLAGDSEFLIGSPFEVRHNPQDEIDHLKHVVARFPKEPRFVLAQGIAIEWNTYPAAPRPSGRIARRTEVFDAFDRMKDDEAIGPEATLRLGVARYRRGHSPAALDLFAKVEASTRDPYLIYLARVFGGQVYEALKRPVDAERSYRDALKAVPRAQTASFLLAALLFKSDRPSEAARVTESTLSAQPQPIDPWREYGAADNRFWPVLIGRLREAITGSTPR